jgi:hypothetical protein
MDVRARLEQLREDLTRGIRQIFFTAMAVEEPAGRSEEWAALCAHYGVALVSDAERDQIRAAQKPLRGAPVMEFRAVVERLARWMRVETKKVNVFDAPSDVERMHDKMLLLLDRIERELVTSYSGEVLPKRQGMFGNVMAHHDPNKKPVWDSSRAHALTCRHCGAPRLKAGDLVCAFCDRNMTGE